MSLTPARLVRVLAASLGELDPGARVASALPKAPPKGARACVVAIGKSSLAMALGAVSRWGAAVDRLVVVAPRGSNAAPLRAACRREGITARTAILTAAHPVPDASSVRAARACLAAVSRGDRAFVLVLVSGGASSLAALPAPGLTLARKRAVMKELLRSGAPIQAMNLVRQHLSAIKGGRLAAAALPSPVLTLVVSDVLDGDASVVGSGPSLPGRRREREARGVLRRYAPAFAGVPLSPPPDLARGATIRGRVVVAPEELAQAYARRLRASGVRVRVLPPAQASVEELALEYVALASDRGREPIVFVRSAEPSVVVNGAAVRAGRGGRSTHLAALVGRALAGVRARATFAAFASDGVDGTSGTAGAIVSNGFAARAERLLGSGAVDRALARFDTGTLHRTVGTALASAPSGHNLADLHVLLVRARTPR